MTDERGAPLGQHEARFLSQVAERFVHLPDDQRADLFAVVTDNLAERPPAATWDALVAELGTPASYAADLREAPIPGAVRGPGDRLKRRRRLLVATAAAAAVAVGVVPVASDALRRTTTSSAPPPELGTGCTGADSDDPRFTFEHLEAADAHEFRMDPVEGVVFRIPVCLGSLQPIDVLDIALFTSIVDDDRFEMSDDFPFQLVRSEPSRTNPGNQVPPPTPEAPVEIGAGTGIDVDLVLRFGACRANPGSRTGVRAVAVTYRYDGEEITEAVDLGALYSVRDVGSCTHDP